MRFAEIPVTHGRAHTNWFFWSYSVAAKTLHRFCDFFFPAKLKAAEFVSFFSSQRTFGLPLKELWGMTDEVILHKNNAPVCLKKTIYKQPFVLC